MFLGGMTAMVATPWFTPSEWSIQQTKQVLFMVMTVYECSLVERGIIIHHCLGESQELRKGDLLFIRPEHSHYFTCVQPASLLTISFSSKYFHNFQNRHHKTTEWPWSLTGSPLITTISQRAAGRLAALLDELPAHSQHPVDIEWALGLILQCHRMEDAHTISRAVPRLAARSSGYLFQRRGF